MLRETYYWKGKSLDEMDAPELRKALADHMHFYRKQEELRVVRKRFPRYLPRKLNPPVSIIIFGTLVLFIFIVNVIDFIWGK